MRGQGRSRVVALKRLASNDPVIWVGLRDALSDVITTAGEEIRVVPAILSRVPVARVGLVLRHGRIVMYSVDAKRVWLDLSALGTVQGASTDSGSTWPSSSSDRIIVWIRIGGATNIRHAVCFSGRREFDRILVVGISVAISAGTMAVRAIPVVVVKARVVRSGSGFRGGKCNILVEPLCTPTADYRCNDKDQDSESDKSYHAERASDSSSVVKETLARIGIHGGSG